jgi:hypothetical protein
MLTVESKMLKYILVAIMILVPVVARAQGPMPPYNEVTQALNACRAHYYLMGGVTQTTGPDGRATNVTTPPHYTLPDCDVVAKAVAASSGIPKPMSTQDEEAMIHTVAQKFNTMPQGK